jgi:hypothetical protein
LNNLKNRSEGQKKKNNMENLEELYEILEYLQEENNKKLNVFNMLETNKIFMEIQNIKYDLKFIKDRLDNILTNQINESKK